MFSLRLERGKYVRVRGKVSANQLIDVYKTPVTGDLYEGKIITLTEASDYCYAAPGDTYEKIAAKYGCDAEILRKLNCNEPVYPTKRVWLGKLN